MGKKRIKKLQAQVEEAREALRELEEKTERKILKAQHKQLDKLDPNKVEGKKESLLDVGEEAFQELKELSDSLINRIKSAIRRHDEEDKKEEKEQQEKLEDNSKKD